MGFYRSEARVIHKFRGLTEFFDRSREDRARPVGDVVGEILKRYEVEENAPVRILMTHWRELFGPQISERCAPERLTEDGTLFIVTSHPQIRGVIRFEERHLLKRLKRLSGCEHIRRLVVR